MRLFIDVLLDYALPAPADVLLQVEVAAMADQRVIAESLVVGSPEALRTQPGEEAIGQRCWALGNERIDARYTATIDIVRPQVTLDALTIAAPRDLPALVSPYLLPSRYVESDLFEAFTRRQFGHLSGGAKVLAMRDWIMREMSYVSGASDGTTTAADSFVRREGVCRDYAHLMAAFARAALIPARLVSVYAPKVEPPDFHAVVEVWLGDSWHLIDATGMADAQNMARIAVGRDATDIAFMTIFGSAILLEQRVVVRSEPGSIAGS